MIDKRKDAVYELLQLLDQNKTESVGKFNKLMRRLYKKNEIFGFGKSQYERIFVFVTAKHLYRKNLSHLDYFSKIAEYDKIYHSILDNPSDAPRILKDEKNASILTYLNFAHEDLGIIEFEQMRKFNFIIAKAYPLFIEQLLDMSKRYVSYKIAEGIIDGIITDAREKETEKRQLADLMVTIPPSDEEIINKFIKPHNFPVDKKSLKNIFRNYTWD